MAEAQTRDRGGMVRRHVASERYVGAAREGVDEDQLELARRAARRHVAAAGYAEDAEFDSRDRVIAVSPRTGQRVYVIED